jgi:excinuclease UvrABC ATPase subunit
MRAITLDRSPRPSAPKCRSETGRVTGVSGSARRSLVFGTIAAESQRMINETYSAFVQGFMPTLAWPEIDILEGLTTASTRT